MTTLPLSPSGPNAPSTSVGSATAGVSVVQVFNPGTREWEPRTLPAAAGGGVTPLSDVWYADGGTSTALADQDGSIGAPYSDILDPLELLTQGTLLCTPGYGYNGGDTAETLPDSNVAIQGLCSIPQGGGISCQLNTITTGLNSNLTVENCSVEIAGDAAVVTLVNCTVPSVDAEDTTLILVGHEAETDTAEYGEITCFGLFAHNVNLAGPITSTGAGDNYIVGCRVDAAITCTGALFVDLYSLATARANGAALTASSITVIDAPTTSLTIDSVAGDAGDVVTKTVALVGAEPGDTFAAVVTDMPDTMLMGAVKCVLADQVKIPFVFGGTENATVEVTLSRLTTAEAS